MEDVLRRYPDRVPVKVDEQSDFDMDRRKYLIPRDMTMSNFIRYIRNRIEIKKSEAVFVIINDVLPPVSSTFDSIYREHASIDKLLHITLKKENTFG